MKDNALVEEKVDSVHKRIGDGLNMRLRMHRDWAYIGNNISWGTLAPSREARLRVFTLCGFESHQGHQKEQNMTNRFKGWRKLHFQDGSIVYYIIKKEYDWYDTSARVLIYVDGMYKNVYAKDIINSGAYTITPDNIKKYLILHGYKDADKKPPRLTHQQIIEKEKLKNEYK